MAHPLTDTNIPIEHLLKHLAELRGVELEEAESNWYNGHAMFPMTVQKISYPHGKWQVDIVYEMRLSEQSHRDVEQNGAIDSVYLWQFDATSTSAPSKDSFVMSKLAWLVPGKFKAGSAQIKSLDAQLLKALKASSFLAGFYNEFVTLPHIRVVGNITDEGYEVNTAVNTITNHQHVAYGMVRLVEETLDALALL